MGDGTSLRGTDVAAMMTRVEATLAAAERSPDGATGVLGVAPEGDREVNVAGLRGNADIRVDFPPGSGRPVVGPAVRLAKRALRRAVSWYVVPMMEQQSTLNHALLDSIERLRVRIERLQPPSAASAGAGLLPLGNEGRALAVGPTAAVLAALLAPPPDDGRIPVLGGEPVAEVGGMESGSLDLLVADVTGMGPEDLVELLRAAFAALAPAGLVVLATGDSEAAEGGTSLHPRALVWALATVGFTDAHGHTVESIVAPAAPLDPSGAEVAERLARVDEAVRSGVEVVVATRAR